jgi:hypothetical protein
MKRKALPFSALILGTLTLALQLPQSVAEGKDAARLPPVIASVRTAPAAAHNAPLPPVRTAFFAATVSTVSSASSVRPAPVVLYMPPAPADPLQALDDPDIDAHHRDLAREVLSVLPVDCQRKLKHFYLLDKPDQRGLAGNGVIMVNRNVPDNEYKALVMHEGLGHFWSLTCLGGTAASGKSAFTDGATPIYVDNPIAAFFGISYKGNDERKALSLNADFVTGYAAQGGTHEDLAESVAYFMTQRAAFTARAKTNAALAAKLQWIQTYFPATQPLGTGQTWNGRIAWDATKLPYVWNATGVTQL